jgi:putative nucleotidyltransferase with HDIG domain
LWLGLDRQDVLDQVIAIEPKRRHLLVEKDTLDNICEAFAEIIDSKSPFTYRHSNGVATAALEIAQWFGMNEREMMSIRRAALLHDLGKLSVSNAILEKPDKLTNPEWTVVKKHPYYTLEILRRIPAFDEFSDDAAAHHERLDGSGYWRGWTADQLSLRARILAVADIFDALAAKRPYRDSLPLETVFGILRKDANTSLDAGCVDALISSKTNSQAGNRA